MLAEERKVIASEGKGICEKRRLEISREAKRHEPLFPNSKSKSGRKTL